MSTHTTCGQCRPKAVRYTADRILLCPLHAQAKALLEALEDISTMADARDANDCARAAIAAAKGEV